MLGLQLSLVGNKLRCVYLIVYFSSIIQLKIFFNSVIFSIGKLSLHKNQISIYFKHLKKTTETWINMLHSDWLALILEKKISIFI